MFPLPSSRNLGFAQYLLWQPVPFIVRHKIRVRRCPPPLSLALPPDKGEFICHSMENRSLHSGRRMDSAEHTDSWL